MKVSVYEAKSKLSQMINRALEGEEVVITRNGEDTVKLIPAGNGKNNGDWIGSWKGKAKIHDSFYDPLDDDSIRYLAGARETPFP